MEGFYRQEEKDSVRLLVFCDFFAFISQTASSSLLMLPDVRSLIHTWSWTIIITNDSVNITNRLTAAVPSLENRLCEPPTTNCEINTYCNSAKIKLNVASRQSVTTRSLPPPALTGHLRSCFSHFYALLKRPSTVTILTYPKWCRCYFTKTQFIKAFKRSLFLCFLLVWSSWDWMYFALHNRH